MSDIQVYKSQLPAKPEDFAVRFKPSNCLMAFNKINSPALCMSSELPTLASIRKTYSDDFIIAYIALWIDNLNDFVNAIRKMKPAQMEETALIIFQEYHFFNIADINLVFRKIKKGEFGQLFAELDGVKILSWFEQYAQERARTAAESAMSNAEIFKADLPRISNRESENVKNMQAIGLHIQEQAKGNLK